MHRGTLPPAQRAPDLTDATLIDAMNGKTFAQVCDTASEYAEEGYVVFFATNPDTGGPWGNA